MITKSEENYLKTIFSVFMQTQNNVSTNKIANLLETSPASVTEMVKKLQEKNLVVYEKYNGVRLSKEGEGKALAIIRKHRLWETFLVRKLDFSWSEVHEVAEQLEHIKSEKLIDKLDHLLNYPKYDPHGDPIPSKSGVFKFQERISIFEMDLNEEGIIMGVSLDNKDFLDYLTKLKIGIGTKIKVIEQIKFDQSMKIEYDSKIEHISKEISENILIKIN